jgi:glycerate dehydrogenase
MAGKNPRIVVLDSHTLNPGDLSWDRLSALGDCTIYERSSPQQVIPRSRDAEVVVTNKAVLSRDVISQLPKLRYIGVSATGYNNVDTSAARERNIPVTNVPVYGTNSVAQMVFAHVLNLTQRVAHHAQAVSAGRWASSADWCFWDFPLIELEGATMGIIGFGRIGQATARLAHAFGMNVLAHDALPVQVPDYARLVDLETVFRDSDVVSLHCPLTADNDKLVNAERLRLMKPTAYLINTSRGPLVDEAALADALNSGRLAGAGIDVVRVEPPAQGNPLFSAKNCYVTPHIAWATHASRQRLLNTAIDNVAAFLSGKPTNVVNDGRLRGN